MQFGKANIPRLFPGGMCIEFREGSMIPKRIQPQGTHCMILIHTATLFEAKAVVDHFGMQVAPGFGGARRFVGESGKLELWVTGIGPKQVVKRLNAMASFYQKTGVRCERGLNLGIAGCTDTNREWGSGTWITHLSEESQSGPPLELATPHPENPPAHLVSFSSAQTDRQSVVQTWGESIWVDMESAFAQACLRPWVGSQYSVYKGISDFLDGSPIDFPRLAAHYDPRAVQAVETFLKWDALCD